MATVNLIPAFDDNYLFSLEVNSAAMIVDPGSAREVLAHMKQNQLQLELILVTHHHGDHIGGVAQLQRATGAKLFGPSSMEKYGLVCDRVLSNGDSFSFHDLKFDVLAVPGHTLDHLAYYNADENILFCGDTLFSLGCGRLFEGTFEQMFNSLARLKRLPGNTAVYCAHEYTRKNAEFSLDFVSAAVPSLHAAYEDLYANISGKRQRGERTVPTTIAFELQHNLFLRASSVEEFRKIREARNRF